MYSFPSISASLEVVSALRHLFKQIQREQNWEANEKA